MKTLHHHIQHFRKTHRSVNERKADEKKSGMKVCTTCRAVYHKRYWHHDSEEFRRLRMREEKQVEHILCPACKMIREHKFEGKVVVQNVPSHFSSELINLILSYAKKARHYNPLHRLIEVQKLSHGLVFTTTEDQLAVLLAKKIRDVFKRAELSIHYRTDAHDATRVSVRFGDELEGRFA